MPYTDPTNLKMFYMYIDGFIRPYLFVGSCFGGSTRDKFEVANLCVQFINSVFIIEGS